MNANCGRDSLVRGSEAAVHTVCGVLDDYARRGVFRGFAKGPVRGGTARFKLLWHRDRYFDLTLDAGKGTLRLAVVLPEVPAASAMYGEFKAFVASRQSGELPAHRRIDTGKARVRCGNRGGAVSLTMSVMDGDWEYGTRKLVQLVHEVYLVFLIDGPYLEYMVAAFGLDPDRI